MENITENKLNNQNENSANEPILQLRNVSVSYAPGKKAVNNVSADIYPNTITAIMGPSGCGKISSGRLIVCDLYPKIETTGDIYLKGQTLWR